MLRQPGRQREAERHPRGVEQRPAVARSVDRDGPWEPAHGHFDTWRERCVFERVLETLQIDRCTELETVVNRVKIGGRHRPEAMAGDQAYSAPGIRQGLRRHSVRAVLPLRNDQHPDDDRVRFDREVYRRRSAVEQCIGWVKECRRIATRLEKLGVNSLAMIELLSIERYFRRLFSFAACYSPIPIAMRNPGPPTSSETGLPCAFRRGAPVASSTRLRTSLLR